jgi:hypothetical protein
MGSRRSIRASCRPMCDMSCISQGSRFSNQNKIDLRRADCGRAETRQGERVRHGALDKAAVQVLDAEP